VNATHDCFIVDTFNFPNPKLDLVPSEP